MAGRGRGQPLQRRRNRVRSLPRGQYSTQLELVEHSLRVFCTYYAGETSVAIGAVTVTSDQGEHMICETIRGSERGSVVAALDDPTWKGSVKHAGHELAIASRHELVGALSMNEPAGYEVKEGATVFAAIQTLHTPAVWMTAVHETKQELAAATLVSGYYLDKVRRRH